MSRFDESQTELLIQCIAASTPEAGKALSRCFDRQFQFDFVDSAPYEADIIPDPEWAGPGLLVSIDLGDESLIVLIPERLPLPAWYRGPTPSQNAKLQTLAMEWSFQLLPRNLEATSYSTVAVDNLHAAVVARQPSHMTAELLFTCRELGGKPNPMPLHAIFPVRHIKAEAPVFTAEPPELRGTSTPSGSTPATPRAGTTSARSKNFGSGAEPAPSPAARAPVSAPSAVPRKPLPAASAERLRIMRSLPVTLSVRLAEKKVELSSLLNISPGTLLTFNKSCEDYLDLYVNNQKYGRGEAIKIGEKFGLRINEIESPGYFPSFR